MAFTTETKLHGANEETGAFTATRLAGEKIDAIGYDRADNGGQHMTCYVHDVDDRVPYAVAATTDDGTPYVSLTFVGGAHFHVALFGLTAETLRDALTAAITEREEAAQS